ncbi:hypothetical protein M1145_02710 [Patescibacteria group bacterium]|nr:hypothetical protein [Patescibacteria group bacterium]
MIKRFIYFVYLKLQLKFLKFKVLKKRLGAYKEDAVSLIESNSHSDLRAKSSISIKNMFYILIVFFALTTGVVFASSGSSNLNQCAPVNGSGLSVWNSCGFTPSIFQSMSISILGNYTQYQNLLGCGSNQKCVNSFHYTGGYGALGDTTALMGYMYTEHPASGVGYFAYLGQKAGFINNTYAAGTSQVTSEPVYGFSFLSPIEHLWAFSRDIAYLLLVIVIIATGLLIIIGGKVGQSQIPITFMSALPNIVAAVILIEFSYALGGFMIDIMNILLVLIFNIFSSGLQHLGNTGFPSAFSSNSYIFHVFGSLPGAISGGLQSARLNKLVTSGGLLGGLLNSLGNLASNKTFSGIIAFLIAIILLFTALKIFILLMKSYLQLLFLPIAAPFMFLFGAFPGQGKMIGKFFMGMAKAVLTFVIVYVVFLLIYYLQHGNNGSPLSFGNGANVPLLGFSYFTSNGGTEVVSVFISIALFVWIPKIVADMTKAFGYDLGAYGTELKKGFSDPYSRLTNWYKRGRGSLSSRGNA